MHNLNQTMKTNINVKNMLNNTINKQRQNHTQPIKQNKTSRYNSNTKPIKCQCKTKSKTNKKHTQPIRNNEKQMKFNTKP